MVDESEAEEVDTDFPNLTTSSLPEILQALEKTGGNPILKSAVERVMGDPEEGSTSGHNSAI